MTISCVQKYARSSPACGRYFIARCASKYIFNLANCSVFYMLTQALFVPYCSSFQIALWRVVKWLGLDREFFWWVSGKRGGGYIQVDQVAYPIFWIVELDREGKFSLRFVGAYRHNSSLGTLFLSLSIYVCVCVFTWDLGALDCSHSVCLAIIQHRWFSTLVFKQDSPTQLNLQFVAAHRLSDIISFYP